MHEATHQVTPPPQARPECPDWQTAGAAPASAEGTAVTAEGSSRRARVFISYKRNADPDGAVAERLFKEFRKQHDVFIDKTMLVGTRWAECIETKLRESDFLVVLLSARSVNSEMVKGEIEKAHQFGKAILPVRLAYREPFPYSLSPYLNPLNWACWEGEEDTARVVEELLLAISGGRLNCDAGAAPPQAAPPEEAGEPPIPQPLPAAQLEMPEGTMDPQSGFYVERATDATALEAIRRQGVTIPIKAPRQMGKSSLLMRVLDAAEGAGKATVLLDFQLFDQAALSSADHFYKQFCSWLTMELGKGDRVPEFWDSDLGNNQRCTRYVGMYLLREVGGPLVLAMDEVDRVFDTSFRSDFFSMLRFWHGSRRAGSVWKMLDLVLVTSTEPYQLIDNLNQSPFNVGEVIELEDFTPAEVRRLNRLHAQPLDEAAEGRLMGLLHGHPYLVRRALYLVASRRTSTAELFAQATDERGPFGDHLRYHLFRMYDKEDLVRGMREVIRHNSCPDERIFFRLRGAGLVRREKDERTGRVAVVPRCQLYADYFGEHLHA